MLIGFLFMKPVLVLCSLTMSVCWIITLAVLLIMLLCHSKIEAGKRYPELFLLTGILTSYFDFLTYPVVTLGFPLCAYFLLAERESIKKGLQKVIGYSFCWGVGYVGMWALKWIIADVTLHTGTIKDAAWSIIGRTEAIGGRPRMNGGFYVIGLNLQEYKWMIYPAAGRAFASRFPGFVFPCRTKTVCESGFGDCDSLCGDLLHSLCMDCCCTASFGRCMQDLPSAF